MESGNLGRVQWRLHPADQRLASPPSILVPTNQWKVMDPTQTQGTRSRARHHHGKIHGISQNITLILKRFMFLLMLSSPGQLNFQSIARHSDEPYSVCIPAPLFCQWWILNSLVITSETRSHVTTDRVITDHHHRTVTWLLHAAASCGWRPLATGWGWGWWTLVPQPRLTPRECFKIRRQF